MAKKRKVRPGALLGAARRRKAWKAAKTRKSRRYKTLPDGSKARIQMNGPFGVPWLVLLGAGVLAYFAFRKPAVAAPTYMPALPPPPPVPQVVDPEDPSGSGNYNYGNF